jgi:hypothetical protein
MRSKVLPLVLFFAMAGKAHAAGHSYTVKSEGCHTYNIFAHQNESGKNIEGVGCGTGRIEPVKRSPTITSDIPVSDKPVFVPDQPSDNPQPIEPQSPENTPEPNPEPTGKPKCNKGEGNGSEGCDPGNNPDKGNDDEN